MTVDVSKLQEIPEVGEIVATHISEFFADGRHQELIAELQNYGIVWPPEVQQDQTGVLAGRIMVIYW